MAGALALVTSAFAEDKLLSGVRVKSDDPKPSHVARQCLTSSPGDLGLKLKGLSRAHSWSLPTSTLSAAGDTLRCLVLRYNFQYESTDDPNTTGRGVMDLSAPLSDSTDSANYYNAIGHWVDPPPHNADYFNAHMRALNYYWYWVSEGKINLKWDIFPPGKDSVYQLAHPMSYYGACEFDRDSIVLGLERYFVDCIHKADSAHIVDAGHPTIDFSQYDAIFLFHAGADRQNDIGFPPTCSDLFTGFIKFWTDSVAVNGGSYFVKEGLMMPEAVSQDNRPVALNAVMAHEFGHQLGLPDIYATNSFLSQVGDFSLMDDNGFGTGLDFGFEAGKVFGAMPIYPDAWCRAYLGISPVVDFRQGSDIRVVAAEAVSGGIKIARVPISETEYYLIENRVDQLDRKDTVLRVDSLTNVFLYPSNHLKEETGEYDYLIPGSGVLIYHIDEAIAALDYDGNGRDNYQDNHIQIWDPILERRFMKLVEADGIIDFGGYYQAGYGSADDMFLDDRNHSFTPNSNPQTIDNSGNATHIFVTDIRRDTVTISGDTTPKVLDTAVRFSVTTEWLADSSPVRCGRPTLGLSPIAADLNKDGTTEIIVPSGGRLLAFEPNGRDFLRRIHNCGCPLVYDTIASQVSGWDEYNTGRLKAVPLYSQRPNFISAGPVVGAFATDTSQLLVAVGYPINNDSGQVILLKAADANNDGQADSAGTAMTTEGWPIALSFGSVLYALTNSGWVYVDDAPGAGIVGRIQISNAEYHGLCRIGNHLIVVAGDSAHTTYYHLSPLALQFDSLSVSGRYNYGPVAVDLNRDGKPEIVGFSKDGEAVLVTCDTSVSGSVFSVLNSKSTGHSVTTNPIAGDLDRDGYPEIVIAGVNTVYAFDERLVLKTDFPKTIDERFPQMSAIASPICGNVEGIAGNSGSLPNLVFPTEAGNFYALGAGKTFGFPLNSGEQIGGESGSPAVLFNDGPEGRLGYLGGDGWFYLWRTGYVAGSMFWPMGSGDQSGSYALNNFKLDPVAAFAEKLPKEKFFNYPNPVTTGQTTIRYFLGAPASSVKLDIYDFSGSRISTLDGGTVGGTDNEVSWDCGAVTPGVYRCVITAQFDGDTQTAFTDIAVIR